MDIVEGQVGTHGDYDLELVEGKLKLVAKYAVPGIGGQMVMELDGAYFIDKLAALIPGSVDDAVFAVLKAAFLK